MLLTRLEIAFIGLGAHVPDESQPTFFETPADFRAWLEAHHNEASVLLVGFYKKGSGRPSITWPESVDQALCFGWIDGVRRSFNENAYTIRFTPRRPGSIWSATNTRRVRELEAEGLMHEAGLRAFGARDEAKTAIYSYEQRADAQLDQAQEEQFRANAEAWSFFERQAPWYRRTATYWISSAKQEATRARRLQQLINDSAAGRLVGPLRRPTSSAT
jgi:uncharacterized protein YdeI (YjbR/CyaY-like superfamily)